ncbi:hypothetical protein RBSH_01118 [Rhodopirellula baltica SH28]|uniref:Uncharacterized protein n=2 Tax=Rhodopirellula baltica TaxID=265606 RepID=F2APY2_RHOBT|nr:hypothetical protein RBWH47_05784 [Rhodopirellula baltica WH47]EKK03669.1 hypothetical protein RBSH_01118 [Rhodopirellula baltica SH28]
MSIGAKMRTQATDSRSQSAFSRSVGEILTIGPTTKGFYDTAPNKAGDA